ncbi:GNAT family protein [Kitasatospora aureofaciens]|uniref:GNAT family N-acetyltransferase n=1 Tax=Kitasatospora aureofaciens TaxID=1894 RepID=UPI0033E780AB
MRAAGGTKPGTDDLVTELLILHPPTTRQARRILGGDPGPDGAVGAGPPRRRRPRRGPPYLRVCADDSDPQGTVTVGYAAEALRALLELARAHEAARVVGDTDLDNTASQRVMAAAGMRPAGRAAHLAYYESAWPPAPRLPGPGEGAEPEPVAVAVAGAGVPSTQAG